MRLPDYWAVEVYTRNMTRTPGQGYPGSDFSPSRSFVPTLHRSWLPNAANAIQFLWYRAFPDLSYVAETGTADTQAGKGQWVRVKQPGVYWCLMDTDERAVKRYLPSGTYEIGTISVAFDPSVTPLSLYDWIVPLGQDGQFSRPQPGLAPRGRTRAYKERIVRGSGRTPGAGTVSTLGAVVTGAGTAFTTFLRAGDILAIGDFLARIVSVASDTALTLETATPMAFIGIGYAKGTDPLSYPPVAAVGDVRSAAREFVFGHDFAVHSEFPDVLSPDTVQWLSAAASPAAGEPYSIAYDYLPRYELTDYGQNAPVVGGVPLLSSAAASLWKPQTAPNL